MVYTVTFNPAIDYVVHTGEMKLGSTNRSDREEMYFGGKGINVSIVLRELDIQSKALGFTAGFTGEAMENGLAEMGIDTDFVHLKKGNSRINVKIKSAEETELNGQGPDIDDEAVNKLFAKLDKLQDGNDYHSNINFQMVYWLPEVGNLSECHLPMLDYLDAMREPDRIATREYLAAIGKPAKKGDKGWIVYTSQNPFGGNGWQVNLPGSAWYGLHFWEHFAFTRDTVYLRKTAYPVLKELSEYWEQHFYFHS